MLRSHRSVGLLLAVATLLTICQPASAYIDGGSGSYLLQILFAAMFGAAYTVKLTYRNIKAAIFRRSHVGEPEPAESKGV